MPRKRRTKLTHRTKPKQPDEDSAHSLAEEEEMARLESFLKDFDIEVETRVSSLRAQMKSMCSTIHQAFHLEILKLPNHLRNAKRLQLFGENEAQEIKEEVDQQVGQLIDSTLKTAPATEATQTKRGRTRKKATTTKKRATTASRKRKTAGQDENQPPTAGRATRTSSRSTRTSSRNRNLETPANTGTLSQLGYDTPFMTPKFDPRLPVTPAMARQPKRGEVLMSFAGSPVINDDGTVKVAAPKAPSLLTNLQKIDDCLTQGEIEDESSRKEVLSKLHGIMDRILKNTNDQG